MERLHGLFGWLLLVAGIAGCQRTTPSVAPAETPAVPVSHPVEREIIDYYDFTGKTVAVNSVDIVARVTGYLTKMPFKEGSLVKAGDLLFEIDPRPYQAQFDQAKSQITLYQAQLELAKSTLARYEALDKTTPGAVSQQALDQYRASVTEAKARVSAQEKSLEVYNLNKEFTQVVSPIDGQVSRFYLTLGNLVNQDQTLLTTVVSLDPIYAYFEMDDRTLLQIRRAMMEGKIKPHGEGQTIPVYMQLQGEDDYPHEGIINFVNNQVNSGTGSITYRGLFSNPVAPGSVPLTSASTVGMAALTSGQTFWPVVPVLVTPNPMLSRLRLMSPGMFVRIRLPVGEPHKTLLVKDSVILSDQGSKYVYVVDKDNKIQSRKITTGSLQPDGLRAISGLRKDDWVVVGSLQQVRPRAEVRKEEIAMESLLSQSEGDAKPAGQPK